MAIGEAPTSGEVEDSVPNKSSGIDARTVFVRGLPLTLSDTQLEEAFGDIGPVRRAFTVKEKSTGKHRGIGFVKFAVAEDAQRAVELKNGTSLEGCKLKIEIAKRRPSLNERRSKRENAGTESKDAQTAQQDETGKKAKQPSAAAVNDVKGNEAEGVPATHAGKKRKQLKPDAAAADDINSPAKKKKRKKALVDDAGTSKPSKGDPTAASQKQKPARTIVVGNLVSPQTVEAVLSLARKLGTVESIQNPLQETDLNDHSLGRDGCKLPAAAIVFTSVKAARQAVATFHQQHIGDGVIWARQLGGEGSGLKKWRLIVRNLAFKVTEELLKEIFTAAGFVWEITIPRKPDGQSKGFGFIGYTSKSDAEKAIQTLNGKKIANRPVAVDWAVAKKKYEKIVNHSADEENMDGSDLEDEDTASDEERDDEDNPLDKGHLSEEDAMEGISEDSDGYESDGKEADLEPSLEVDLVKRVLDKVVTNPVQASDDADKEEIVEEVKPKSRPEKIKAKDSKPEKIKAKDSNTYSKDQDGKDDRMERTLFVRNLPPESKVNDLKMRFSTFGNVRSFRLVLNPVTKKPKGTAFVEFATREAAEAAAEAAKGAEKGTSGLVIGGSPVALHFAVDRDCARDISKTKSIEERDHDRRNLYLVKEGFLEPGTPAAEGVSKSDLMQRQALQNEKSTKLRSPNFHVSKTRLAVHNLPKSLTEKELKELFIKAVKFRATKQHPVIKQVKLLKDDKSRSRGAGFVEFTEHQHALVALRVLNNNPDTFGPEKRPIVEFSIENTLKLRKRETRLAATKLRGPKVEDGREQKKFLKSKRWDKLNGEEKPASDEKATSKPKRKRAHEDEVKQTQASEKADGKSRTKPENAQPGRQAKRRKIGGPEESNLRANVPKDKGSRNAAPRKFEKSGHDQKEQPARPAMKRKESPAASKNKPQNGKPAEEKKRRGKAETQAEDKLDKLVNEYRAKYFNEVKGGSSQTGTHKALDNIKRWFD